MPLLPAGAAGRYAAGTSSAGVVLATDPAWPPPAPGQDRARLPILHPVPTPRSDHRSDDYVPASMHPADRSLPYPRASSEQRRRHHITPDSQLRQLPVKYEDGETASSQARKCSGEPSLRMNLRIESSRLGIVPRLRTSPSGSATATAIVSAWTSKPKNRNFSLMTGSFRLWLWTSVLNKLSLIHG